MERHVGPSWVAPVCVVIFWSGVLAAETINVRHTEGVVRGFLALRTLEGVTLAEGDLTQVARGERVTSRMTFRFKDGSLHDETTVFSEQQQFRLIQDHLVQRGPTFPQQLDVSIETANGQVTVRSRESGKEEKVSTKQLELPQDVSNGLILTLIKNLDRRASATAVSMVAAAPAPRLVKVVISPAGEDPFWIAGTSHKAIRYTAHIEIGGVAGAVASLLGKQPPDTHVWILPGEAPAFVKSEGPLYFGGPIWRIELTSPVWPRSAPTPSSTRN